MKLHAKIRANISDEQKKENRRKKYVRTQRVRRRERDNEKDKKKYAYT